MEVGFLYVAGPYRARFTSRMGSRTFLTQFPEIPSELDENFDFVTSDHLVTVVGNGDSCADLHTVAEQQAAWDAIWEADPGTVTSEQLAWDDDVDPLLLLAQSAWDLDIVEGETPEEKVLRLGERPVDTETVEEKTLRLGPRPVETVEEKTARLGLGARTEPVSTPNYRWQALPTAPEPNLIGQALGDFTSTIYDLHTAIIGAAPAIWTLCWAFDLNSLFIPWGTLEIKEPENKTDVINFTVILSNEDLVNALEFPEERPDGEPWLWPLLNDGLGKTCTNPSPLLPAPDRWGCQEQVITNYVLLGAPVTKYAFGATDCLLGNCGCFACLDDEILDTGDTVYSVYESWALDDNDGRAYLLGDAVKMALTRPGILDIDPTYARADWTRCNSAIARRRCATGEFYTNIQLFVEPRDGSPDWLEPTLDKQYTSRSHVGLLNTLLDISAGNYDISPFLANLTAGLESRGFRFGVGQQLTADDVRIEGNAQYYATQHWIEHQPLPVSWFFSVDRRFSDWHYNSTLQTYKERSAEDRYTVFRCTAGVRCRIRLTCATPDCADFMDAITGLFPAAVLVNPAAGEDCSLYGDSLPRICTIPLMWTLLSLRGLTLRTYPRGAEGLATR
jgi:hypothetical protein